ncbi:MAG: tRNA lysidine(34) synthetase TilS [Chitinophagaceae bacterium]
MLLIQSFVNNIKKANLFSPKDKLIIAVSGGIDSIVLCELCYQSKFDFSIAHCNFQLRGEESERDEKFVKELGEKYSVEVFIKRFDTEKYAAENKLSIQEAARELRYSWFEELITNKQLAIGNEKSWLLTAHHSDDNTETVLMNFFRGTGLHGLTGMPVKTAYIRRPLLNFSREDIVYFAKENNLPFVEDSSNSSTKYTRNFFRHEIIPAISKKYPQVKENLKDNIKRFKEIESLYQFSVGAIKKKLCKKKGKEVHIPVKQLMLFNNKALIYEIISEYGFSEGQVDEVIKLSESESGRYIQSTNNNFHIIKHRHWFIISPALPQQSENIIIEKEMVNVQLPTGSLQFSFVSPVKGQQSTANYIATLDAKEITFPLLLRKWKTGDYFYPLGMTKKKKLARFFIDQKLSKTEKEKVWVIEMNKKIIWVVGHRIDERFKITDQTKEILKISFISGQIE